MSAGGASEIPKIVRSRSQLHCYVQRFADGGGNVFLSSDTYPHLFDLLCPEVARKSVGGWRVYKEGRRRYRWFPAGSLTDEDVKRICDFTEHFEQYVLIGLNQHLKPHFTNELDFCIALDFIRETPESDRTVLGEAEYQVKYHHSATHFIELCDALVEAIAYLPLSAENRTRLLLTNVPCEPNEPNVGMRLATAVAQSLKLPHLRANLLCDKSAMKDMTVDQKVPAWQALYESDECIKLHGEVKDRPVVIIDDLYQSGATMWCYARYLKVQGARCVLGLPCVKSLRDTDNR